MTTTASCSIEGCAKPPFGRGMCSMHYTRQRRQGALPALPGKPQRSCSVQGCEQAHSGHGYCRKHLARFNEHGDPLVRLNSEGPTLQSDGYLVRRAKGHPLATRNGLLREHRRVLWDKLGPGEHPCYWCLRPLDWFAPHVTENKLVVDHLDGNRANNSAENLVPSCPRCNGIRRRHDWQPGQRAAQMAVSA